MLSVPVVLGLALVGMLGFVDCFEALGDQSICDG